MILKYHKRSEKVSKAKIEFGLLVCDFLSKNNLTWIEMSGILIDKLADANKYALRFERHGNYTKKADEA